MGVSLIFEKNSRDSKGSFDCFCPRKDDEARGHALDIEKESKMRGRLKIMERRRTKS